MTPLERLEEAAGIAAELGLDDMSRSARDLLERSAFRLGFPGDVYVLALVGGTGVGKSSVLNALAGLEVSPARALRPTTEHPLAWVANDAREVVAPLIDWLGVTRVTGHDRGDLAGVAILDLPDVDSIRPDHRATVDSLLPRIDAVAWVVDPEKYDDDVLHGYLRQAAPHADRMWFVFNKADRLDADARQTLEEDFRRRLADDGIEEPTIAMVSAADGTGIETLRASIDQAADAKAVVASKLAADVGVELESIARAAAVEPGNHSPLLSAEDRREAVTAAVGGALALVDPDGVARQTQQAVLHRAHRQGGSLVARLGAVLASVMGRNRRLADPAAYLAGWRKRGSLGHVLNPVRSALVKAASPIPLATRPAILKALGAEDAEAEVIRAIDRSTRKTADELGVPRSILWPVVGFFQLVAGAALLFAVAWYLVVIFGPGGVPVATMELPYLGPVPTPLLLIGGALVLSFVLGVVLNMHAGMVGRRIGLQLAGRVEENVSEAVTKVGFGGLDRVESARQRLASLTGSALDSPSDPR